MKLKPFGRICVTSDLYKIDDRAMDKTPNPQRINIDWLQALVAKPISDALGGLNISSLYGDEGGMHSPRMAFYSKCGLPLDSHSWAYIYETRADVDFLDSVLDPYFFNDDLVLCFEAPGYMIDYFIKREIPYLDFTVHPIRFLPDYMFGIRTNIPKWRKKLAHVQLPETVIRDFARVSAARTKRVYRHNVPPNGSAIFLGQLEVDASLIHNGFLATTENVENALVELSLNYPNVYYKAHPHLKDQKSIREIVKKISNCHWLEVNIYDALGCEAFDLISSLSSGAVLESRYFGCHGRWFLDRADFTDAITTEPNKLYYPIYEHSVEASFWKYVLLDQIPIQKFNAHWPRASEGAFKFSLNQKWGR